MTVKTTAHKITVDGIWAIVPHQAQPFPPYYVVIALPPKGPHQVFELYPGRVSWVKSFVAGLLSRASLAW